MTPQLALYRKFFPNVHLNFVQNGMIDAEVVNLKVWEKSLIEWAGNGWRGESVFKLISMYQDKCLKYGDDHETPEPECSRCNDLKTVMVPKEGSSYAWEMTPAPCPDCAKEEVTI